MSQSVEQFAAFAATARHGSFAAAARELGSAPSGLAKAVGRLEESLGVKLFHRTTRQVRLTPDGERLFERCSRLLAEFDALRAEASGARSEPAGLLRVDMPIVLGRTLLLPVLAGLARRYPALELDLRFSDGYADLVKEGIDVAIRVGELEDSSLVAQPFGRQEMVLVAAPGLLAARGAPRGLAGLERYPAVLFRMPTSGRSRPWRVRRGGEEAEMVPRSSLRVNDGEALVAAVRLGLGIGQVPDYFVRSEIATGELVEVLPAWRPAPLPISAVYPGARLVPARVRAFLDALTALRNPRTPSRPVTSG